MTAQFATTEEVAAGCGLHQTTILRWAKQGLLPAPEVRNMGRRGRTSRWPTHAPAQARWVRRLLDSGLSIDETRDLVAHLAAPAFLRLEPGQQDRIVEEIRRG